MRDYKFNLVVSELMRFVIYLLLAVLFLILIYSVENRNPGTRPAESRYPLVE